MKPNADGRSKKRPGILEQKNNVLAAAVELFGQYSTKHVSISQICEHAEITRPTFYRCFKDKDALLAELYENSVKNAVERILLHHFMEGAERKKGWMKSALEDVYEAIFDQAELADLLFREASDTGSPAHTLVDSTFDDIAAALIKSAGVKKDKPVVTIYFKSIMAANQWIVHDAINKGLTPKARKEAKQACWLLTADLVANSELDL